MLRIPTVTRNLLMINILCFIGMLVMSRAGVADLNNVFGLHFFMASDFHVYQLVTYMFMHGGWEHIILNMLMLWMFGAVIERVWGAKRFIVYYFFCGVGAGLMQELAQFAEFCLMASNNGYSMSLIGQIAAAHDAELGAWTTVGASGAIYALLLAFGMTFPEEKMFIIPIPIPIKAKWMVMGAIVVNLFSALASPGSQVAHLAHLGGMIFGFFLIRYWRRHPFGGGFDAGTSFFRNMRSRWESSRSGGGKWSGRMRANSGSARGNASGNPDWDYNAKKNAAQEEIDRILDKIRKSGYDSLTRDEKQTLFDQSRK